MTRWSLLLLVLPAALTAGCPVTQSQDTPVPAIRRSAEAGGGDYWLYVPSNYDAGQSWPLVVTLHGTHGWDSSRAQIAEWKALAEAEGFIVAAPQLKSVQGILPVVRSLWYADLERDERVILSIVDELSAEYSIDPGEVLLTGFSAGGYPFYYTGLRNPDRFDMLIARACNSSIEIFERVELTDAARELPILIFWGKDDLPPLREQSWEAFRYLRQRGFDRAEMDEIKGGHLRRPEIAWREWSRRLERRRARDR